MQISLTRRNLIRFVPLGLAAPLVATPETAVLSPTFPTQSPDLAREMVSVSHGNVKRVRELVTAHPTLAKASWDWGFGDWETALGAASHVGNREIATYLIEQGAPPTLCSATMLGQLDVVKALIAANPGTQRIPGPHGISLLAHAKAGGATSEPVKKYLESLGDADAPPSTPLSETEMTALTGTYAFGAAPNDRIEITMARGQLLFTRAGTTGRPLTHKGDRAFSPAGAKDVRIRFTEEAGEARLSIHDPGLILTARRTTSDKPKQID